MFCGCSSLNSINLSSFNTSNVTNMSGMFFNCSSLKKSKIISNKRDNKLLNEMKYLK